MKRVPEYMAFPPGGELAPIRRLNALTPISPETRTRFARLLGQSQSVAPGSPLVSDGATSSGIFAVLDGWACRTRILSDGRRQVVQFALPGDLIGFDSASRVQAPNSVIALSRMTVAYFTHSLLRQPGLEELATAFSISAGLDNLYVVNQVVRLGRLTAYERIAHLLFELRDRLALAGRVANHSFPMPLTQEILADTLGLTSVHINRTLQQMRREQMIQIGNGIVTLLDPAALSVIAEYHPQRISAAVSPDPWAHRIAG